jgi:hypothetical protein
LDKIDKENIQTIKKLYTNTMKKLGFKYKEVYTRGDFPGVTFITKSTTPTIEVSIYIDWDEGTMSYDIDAHYANGSGDWEDSHIEFWDLYQNGDTPNMKGSEKALEKNIRAEFKSGGVMHESKMINERMQKLAGVPVNEASGIPGWGAVKTKARKKREMFLKKFEPMLKQYGWKLTKKSAIIPDEDELAAEWEVFFKKGSDTITVWWRYHEFFAYFNDWNGNPKTHSPKSILAALEDAARRAGKSLDEATRPYFPLSDDAHWLVTNWHIKVEKEEIGSATFKKLTDKLFSDGKKVLEPKSSSRLPLNKQMDQDQYDQFTSLVQNTMYLNLGMSKGDIKKILSPLVKKYKMGVYTPISY